MAHGQSGLDGQAVLLLVVQGFNHDTVTVQTLPVVVIAVDLTLKVNSVILIAVQ